MTAQEALTKLRNGNKKYVESCATGDVSPQVRAKTYNGQAPFAVVVGCSDSRVIPETVFCAGIGELFVVRLAGNVADGFALGSIQYALEHLGCSLVVVLGHEHCGAVHATICGGAHGYTKALTDSISAAIGTERNELAACKLNVLHNVESLQKTFPKTTVVGAVYMLETGKVVFDL